MKYEVRIKGLIGIDNSTLIDEGRSDLNVIDGEVYIVGVEDGVDVLKSKPLSAPIEKVIAFVTARNKVIEDEESLNIEWIDLGRRETATAEPPTTSGYLWLVERITSHPGEFKDSFTEDFEQATDILDRFSEKTGIKVDGASPQHMGRAVTESIKKLRLGDLLESKYVGTIHKYRLKAPKAQETRIEDGIRKATDTAIVGRGTNICIREGPLNDLLSLPSVTYDTAKPVLHKWYPNAASASLDNYAAQYIGYMRAQGLIDMWNGKPSKQEVAKPVQRIPTEKLTVMATVNYVDIYQEPLNELLKLDTVDDESLEKILSRYYDVSRPAFLLATKKAWKNYLENNRLIDEHGHPIAEKVEVVR